jgi:hypothetical protein
LGIIIGANLVNRCASAQSNFPMCVTVYKYLVWPNLKSGSIPIGTTTQDYPNGVLLNSGFEVKDKALKFPAASQPSGEEGMIYYDSSKKKFLCYQDNPNTPQVDPTWIDCGGGGSPVTPPELIAPITIWRDSSKTFKVLEISEE